MNLEDCVPKDKHDATALQNAEAVGFPALNPILSQLLAWVQDINWPVAQPAAVLLRSAGPELAPHIIEVLRGDDEAWKANVLRYLAGYLPEDAWLLISDDVARVASNPTPREAADHLDEAARTALASRHRG